jgi:hypothetical protein
MGVKGVFENFRFDYNRGRASQTSRHALELLS